MGNDFYYNNFPWFVHGENERQFLSVRRHNADWTKAEIDYEFSFDKDQKKLEIGHFTQEALEYFVKEYGSEYEYLYFNNATRIKDFSPLSDLRNLKSLSIDYYRSEKLWDMKNNEQLTDIRISYAKKYTKTLSDISSCKSLENLMINGDMDSPYVISSLSCFENMPKLRRIDFLDIKLESHDISFLKTLPSLEEFNFDAGMLTTEEIAFICAKYPSLKGRSLGAYTTHFTINDVRICGFRKPSLNLPEQQKRFDEYVLEFITLVEKYKNQ